MANSAHTQKVLGTDRIKYLGKFRPNGATGIVSGSEDTRAVSWARTSAGLYTGTLDKAYPRFLGGVAAARGADGKGVVCSLGDYSSTNKTIQLRVFDAEGYGQMPLDISLMREIASNDIQNLAAHGGLLASDSTPTLARVNGATDKALRATWAAGDTTEVHLATIPMLPNMNGSNDITVHLLAGMESTNDTPTIDIQAFDGVGDTEMGGATGALSDTIAEVSTTLAAADLSGHPTGVLNLALVPGSHATDDLYLYAAWLEWGTLIDLADDADNEVSYELNFSANPGNY